MFCVLFVASLAKQACRGGSRVGGSGDAAGQGVAMPEIGGRQIGVNNRQAMTAKKTVVVTKSKRQALTAKKTRSKRQALRER